MRYDFGPISPELAQRALDHEKWFIRQIETRFPGVTGEEIWKAGMEAGKREMAKKTSRNLTDQEWLNKTCDVLAERQ
jgi:hypothetical protein